MKFSMMTMDSMKIKFALYPAVFLAGILLVNMLLLPGSAAQAPSMAPRGTQLVNHATPAIQLDNRRQSFVFRYEDGQESVEYMIYLRESAVRKGLLSVRSTMNDRHRSVPLDRGGFLVQHATQTLEPIQVAAEAEVNLTEVDAGPNSVRFVYHEVIDNVTLSKSYKFSLQGKTLVIHAKAESPPNATTYYSGFDFTPTRYTSQPQIYQLPSVPMPFYSYLGQYFQSTYVDPLRSNTSGYEWHKQKESQTSVYVANTPARLQVMPGEKPPPIEVVAYLTASSNPLDVIPAPALHSPPKPTPLRVTPLFDLNLLPLAPWPYQSTQLVRRWVAPASGLLQIQGTYSLAGQTLAGIEVQLTKQESAHSQTLFTQVLDPSQKRERGIQGEFVINQGDELRFVSYSPAVWHGGEVRYHIQLNLDGKTYSTFNDFHNRQGFRGWHYEQKIDERLVPLTWNGSKLRWESAYNRSSINANTFANKAAGRQDPLAQAQAFFDEMAELGIHNAGWLLSGWKAIKTTETSGYERLIAGEQARGNLVFEPLGLMDVLPAWNQAKTQSATPALETHLDAFAGLLRNQAEQFASKGILLNLQALTTPFQQILAQPSQDTPGDRSQRRLHTYMNSAFSILTHGGKRRLLLDGHGENQRWLPRLASLADAVFPPYYPESSLLKFVDEDLFIGRMEPRIGFGGPREKQWIDPRFHPTDTELTGTVAFGRVPSTAGNLWSDGMEARSIRKWFLEHYALLQPLMGEYLDPNNSLKTIQYLNDADAQPVSGSQAVLQNALEKMNRVKIEYQNGLGIYANRGAENWKIPGSKIFHGSAGRNGFIAFNPNTGLKVLVGELDTNSASFAKTSNTVFMHSRQNRLTHFDAYSTDGMVYLRQSPFDNKQNITGLDMTALIEYVDLTPLFQASAPIDLTWRWKNAETVIIHILQTEGELPMLELFNLPSSWQKEGRYQIQAHSLGADGTVSPEPVYWSHTKTRGHAGIRLLELSAGTRIQLTPGTPNQPQGMQAAGE